MKQKNHHKFDTYFHLGGSGNNNDGSGKLTFLCPKCGNICTHVENLVSKFLMKI